MNNPAPPPPRTWLPAMTAIEVGVPVVGAVKVCATSSAPPVLKSTGVPLLEMRTFAALADITAGAMTSARTTRENRRWHSAANAAKVVAGITPPVIVGVVLGIRYGRRYVSPIRMGRI